MIMLIFKSLQSANISYISVNQSIYGNIFSHILAIANILKTKKAVNLSTNCFCLRYGRDSNPRPPA